VGTGCSEKLGAAVSVGESEGGSEDRAGALEPSLGKADDNADEMIEGLL
jgi:hypothetical protein